MYRVTPTSAPFSEEKTMTVRNLIGYRRNGAPIYLAQGGAPTPHEIISSKRGALLAQRGAILDKAVGEKRGLLASEQREHNRLSSEILPLSQRLDDIADLERRQGLDNMARKDSGFPERSGPVGGAYTSGGSTYHRGEQSPSFFRDLWTAQRGDADAADRLRSNNREVGMESRALGNTNATGGSAGEFAPPAWILDAYVKLARPGRVTADLFHKEDLPAGVSSVNIPRVATGTTVAIQSMQNTAVSQTDLTTNSLSSGIVTLAGKQVISQQLLDQSGTGGRVDEVVLGDLTGDLARQLGTQVLTGTGVGGQLKGFLTATSSNVLPWTTTTPTATGFYGRLAQLQGAINSTRFKAPDVIVMHPRRWAWFASFTDSTGRPLVVPSAGAFNSMASAGDDQAVGRVGSVLGCDVYTDPNIPVNRGGGTEDVVLMFVRDDVWLWEANLRAEAFTSPLADVMGILYRVYNYFAMVPDRYSASLGQIAGSGLVTPAFAA